jgi:hypothetical protein
MDQLVKQVHRWWPDAVYEHPQSASQGCMLTALSNIIGQCNKRGSSIKCTSATCCPHLAQAACYSACCAVTREELKCFASQQAGL